MRFLTKIRKEEDENELKNWKQKRLGNRKNVASCLTCGINAHNDHKMPNPKIIHELFPNMTCMEIAHSRTGREIWNRGSGGSVRRAPGVNWRHAVVVKIRGRVEAAVEQDKN